MPRVSVWIPKDQLKIIDDFCKKNKKVRSIVLRNSALKFIAPDLVVNNH